MSDDLLLPAWPRLPADASSVAATELLALSAHEVHELVSTDVTNRKFYATAPVRVNKKVLDGVRDAILVLATKHGFPGERLRRVAPTFDQELAVLAPRVLPMLPVEAADEEVWAFLTLKIVPDVAVWRWPGVVSKESTSDAEEEADPRTSRLDRLFGSRRGMLRQAWWRSYLLGEEACLTLDEDNFIQLTDRMSLTGDRRVGNIIVDTHMAMRGRDDYDNRYGLRRAMVLIGRLHGRLSVEALPDDVLRKVIQRAFEQACEDLRSVEDASPTSETSLLGSISAVERFLELVSEHVPMADNKLASVSREDALRLAHAARQYAKELVGDDTAGRIADDLNGLVDEWHSLEDDERRVVAAALEYFLNADDALSDSAEGGLTDDDEVVNAAFIALGRSRAGG